MHYVVATLHSTTQYTMYTLCWAMLGVLPSVHSVLGYARGMHYVVATLHSTTQYTMYTLCWAILGVHTM